MHPKIRNGEIDPLENLGVLLVEFFELYGYYFHYSEVGISLQKGGQYFSKEEREWRHPQKPWLLTIEDPLVESKSYYQPFRDLRTKTPSFLRSRHIGGLIQHRQRQEDVPERVRELDRDHGFARSRNRCSQIRKIRQPPEGSTCQCAVHPELYYGDEPAGM